VLIKIGKKLNSAATPISETDEREWLRLVSGGDERALEMLYRRYYQPLIHFVYRMSGTTQFAEEVINDVMLVVWNKARTYNGECKPSTWIFGIAFNKVRKKAWTHPLDISLDETEQHVLESKQVDPGFTENVETEQWLEQGFQSLSLAQRAVVEFVLYHGLHYCEIAKILNCPENTIKTRMYHARKILKKALDSSVDSIEGNE